MFSLRRHGRRLYPLVCGLAHFQGLRFVRIQFQGLLRGLECEREILLL